MTIREAHGLRGRRLQRVARVRPADVRPERAGESVRVSRHEGEVVVAPTVAAEGRIVPDGSKDEGRAARPSADQLRGQPAPPLRIARPVGTSRPGVHEPPEASDVLGELAPDEVGAVPPEVLARGLGLRHGQEAARIGGMCHGRHGRTLAVLVFVAEQELAGLHDGLSRQRRLPDALDRRLRDAVPEAEGLVGIFTHRVLPEDRGEPGGGRRTSPEAAGELIQGGGARSIEQEQDVDRVGARATDRPARRSAVSGVAEHAGPLRHPEHELAGERLHCVVVESELLQARRGEGDVRVRGGLRLARRAAPRGGDRTNHGRQPRPGRIGAVDADEEVAAVLQVGVAARDDSLNVVELHLTRAAAAAQPGRCRAVCQRRRGSGSPSGDFRWPLADRRCS